MSKKGKKYTNKMTKAMNSSKDIKRLKKIIAVEKQKNDKKESLQKRIWNDCIRFQDELNDLKSTVIHNTTKYCREIIDVLECRWPEVDAEQIVIIRKAQEGLINHINEMCANAVSTIRDIYRKVDNDTVDGHKALSDMKAVYEETRTSMIFYIDGTKSNGMNTYYLTKLKARIRSQMKDYIDAINTIDELGNKK